MDVKVDSSFESRLEALARSQGRTVGDVLREVIQKGLAQMPDNGNSVGPGVWKPKLLRLLDEMRSLPVESPDDGFSGVDHDDVLYPRSP